MRGNRCNIDSLPLGGELWSTRVDTTGPSTSDSTFEQLLDPTPDAIVGVDREGRIVLANNQTAILFGYSHEKLIGQMVEELVPDRFKGDHPGHRDSYFDEPRNLP